MFVARMSLDLDYLSFERIYYVETRQDIRQAQRRAMVFTEKIYVLWAVLRCWWYCRKQQLKHPRHCEWRWLKRRRSTRKAWWYFNKTLWVQLWQIYRVNVFGIHSNCSKHYYSLLIHVCCKRQCKPWYHFFMLLFIMLLFNHHLLFQIWSKNLN